MRADETELYWFARRNGAVRGPFTVDHIKRCILLGRIRLNDELSQDEFRWRPVIEYPDLFPDEFAGASSPEDYRSFLAAYRQADERVGERRQANGKLPSGVRTERRIGPDRRNGSWLVSLVQLIKLRSEKFPQVQPLRVLLLATLIVSLVLAYLSTFSR